MPSYTTSLRLIQPATGEYSGSWGTQVNNGITALVDTSVAGTASITMTAADYTLSTANGATDEARAMFLVLGGTPGAARNVICPAVSKLYYVTNNTTGGFAQTVKTSAGTGISVPNGASMVLRCDGTNVVEAQNSLGSIILNGGTANGVAYLNASKALTTGSALVFDGTNLGVGTSSPGAKLEVRGSDNADSMRFSLSSNTNGAYQGILFTAGAYSKAAIRVYSTGTTDAGSLTFWTSPAGDIPNLRATLDSSGNLGLGVTSPSYPLHINKSFSVYGLYLNNTSTSTGDYNVVAVTGASSGMPFMMLGAGGTAVANTGVQGAGYVGTQNNTPLVFVTNDAARARITSGGALVVGNTAAAGSEILCASNNDANTAPFSSWNRATAGDNFFAGWYTEGTATIRGSIDYNRAGGLVRYNTTSDYRAKDILGPITNSGATIDALKVYEGVMKGATQSRPMLIAHEAQEHVPFCVSGEKDEENEDGSPKFQQMDHASLVPLLLAEIQSLRARVAALEAA